MNDKLLKLAAVASLVASLAACVTINAAPGADKVRITEVPADVQACKAVGNIDGTKVGGNDTLMRNEVIGDGGDTLLMTVPRAALGIAYRCGKD
jgi:hypothetical protein